MCVCVCVCVRRHAVVRTEVGRVQKMNSEAHRCIPYRYLLIYLYIYMCVCVCVCVCMCVSTASCRRTHLMYRYLCMYL